MSAHYCPECGHEHLPAGVTLAPTPPDAALREAVAIVYDVARRCVPRGAAPHTPNGHDCEACAAMRTVDDWLAGVTLAPTPPDALREALAWALHRLAKDGYSHDATCSPTECSCGFWAAAAALGDKP